MKKNKFAVNRLIESPKHKYPHRHCQHVAIDQINSNLYLQNHIKRWHERQNVIFREENIVLS
jgi:hypothetical protein